jgi:hypothetical protein
MLGGRECGTLNRSGDDTISLCSDEGCDEEAEFLSGRCDARSRLAKSCPDWRRYAAHGVLASNPPSAPVAASLYAAFYAGLNERGWVEGRNILIEGRYAAGRTERFAEFAAELVALDVEVIVVLGGTQAAQAAKHATSKIPIVFAGVGDAVGLGLVDSLARPGGNLTGVTYESVVEKHVDLLRAFVPNLERVGSIWQPSNPGGAQWKKNTIVTLTKQVT